MLVWRLWSDDNNHIFSINIRRYSRPAIVPLIAVMILSVNESHLRCYRLLSFIVTSVIINIVKDHYSYMFSITTRYIG